MAPYGKSFDNYILSYGGQASKKSSKVILKVSSSKDDDRCI